MKIRWIWIGKRIWYPWLVWGISILLIGLILAPIMESRLADVETFPLGYSFLIYCIFLGLNMLRIFFEGWSCRNERGNGAVKRLLQFGVLNGLAYLLFQCVMAVLWYGFQLSFFAPFTILNRPFQVLTGSGMAGALINTVGYILLSSGLYWGMGRFLSGRRYR